MKSGGIVNFYRFFSILLLAGFFCNNSAIGLIRIRNFLFQDKTSVYTPPYQTIQNLLEDDELSCVKRLLFAEKHHLKLVKDEHTIPYQSIQELLDAYFEPPYTNFKRKHEKRSLCARIHQIDLFSLVRESIKAALQNDMLTFLKTFSMHPMYFSAYLFEEKLREFIVDIFGSHPESYPPKVLSDAIQSIDPLFVKTDYVAIKQLYEKYPLQSIAQAVSKAFHFFITKPTLLDDPQYSWWGRYDLFMVKPRSIYGEMLKNEKTYQDTHIAGYHGCSDQAYIMFRLITLLHEKKYRQSIFTEESMLIRPFFPTDNVSCSIFDAYAKNESLNYTDWQTRRAYLCSHGVNGDGQGKDQRDVLSLNIGIWGSLKEAGTCPISYAEQNYNQAVIHSSYWVAIKKIMSLYNAHISDDTANEMQNYYQKLVTKYKAAEETKSQDQNNYYQDSLKNGGFILQFFIPRSLADEYTYNASGGGVLIIVKDKDEKTLTVKGLIDAMRNNPFSSFRVIFENKNGQRFFDRVHYRLTTTQDVFFNENGTVKNDIKIIPHALNKEFQEEIDSALNALMEQITFN